MPGAKRKASNHDDDEAKKMKATADAADAADATADGQSEAWSSLVAASSGHLGNAGRLTSDAINEAEKTIKRLFASNPTPGPGTKIEWVKNFLNAIGLHYEGYSKSLVDALEHESKRRDTTIFSAISNSDEMVRQMKLVDQQGRRAELLGELISSFNEDDPFLFKDIFAKKGGDDAVVTGVAAEELFWRDQLVSHDKEEREAILKREMSTKAAANHALVAVVKNQKYSDIISDVKKALDNSHQGVRAGMTQLAAAMAPGSQQQTIRSTLVGRQELMQRFIEDAQKAVKTVVWQEWFNSVFHSTKRWFEKGGMVLESTLNVGASVGTSTMAKSHATWAILLGIALVGAIIIGGRETCVSGMLWGKTCTKIYPQVEGAIALLKKNVLATALAVPAAALLPANATTVYLRRREALENVGQVQDGFEGGRKKRLSRSRPLRRRRKGKKTKKILKKRRSGSRKRQKGRSKHSPTRRSKHSPTRRSKHSPTRRSKM